MNDAADQHPADSMPGRALAVARAAQNLSVADVARQLRLSPLQVEALEAGAYDRLPGPVFVRGFLRNYARLLKMDPERLLQAALPDLPAPAASEAAPVSQDIPFPGAEPRRWPWYAAASLAIFGALAAYEFYWSDRTQAVITTVTTPVAQPETRQPADRVAPGDAAQPAASPAGAAAVPDAPPEAAAVMPVKPVAAAAAPAGEEKSLGAQRTLTMLFEKESWVQIRDREGKTIFLRHNQPGTEQRVTGLPPFTLVIGNASGVRLTYNDRPVDLSPHARDDVARLTLE